MHGGLLIIGGRRSGPGLRAAKGEQEPSAVFFLLKVQLTPRDLRRAPLPIVRGLIDVGWGRLSSRGRGGITAQCAA